MKKFRQKISEKTEVPQDKDIKDREGTQPASYYKGLKKSTKTARARHFEKGKKMDDDNPAAYKKAPGDATAKTKLSKHTLKYRKMYGESSCGGETYNAKPGGHEWGTDKGTKYMKKKTPKQNVSEKLDPKKHDAGDYIKDFQDSDAPQFKGKSKEKRRKMALAAYLQARREMNEAIKKTPFGPKGRAAHAHITALGKKHGRSFGDQRLHIMHFPNKYDKKTNDHAKVLDRHQFGGKAEEHQIGEAKYSVDVEGIPRFYVDADSHAQVKVALRKILKKATMIKDVERVNQAKIKQDYRERITGKHEDEE